MIREDEEILCVPLRHTYYELNSRKLPEKQSINIRQKKPLESMTNVIWCQDIQTRVSGSLKSSCGPKACLGYLIHKCIQYRCGFGSVSKELAQ